MEEKFIWTLWWQGEKNAPEIVKKCFNNMKKYSNGARVIVLDRLNYVNYIELPEIIERKFKEGKITITHLSDVIRFLLLYKYGGLWMDSTIYISDYLPQNIFDYNFYSIKNGTEDKKNISKNRWTSFLLGGKAGNFVFNDISNMFVEYWKKYDDLACYFLIDFCLNNEYKKSTEFRNQIDLIPSYEGYIFKMANEMNDIEDIEKIGNLENIGLFQKLNWRFKIKNSRFQKIKSLKRHIVKLLDYNRIKEWGFTFVWLDFCNSIFNSSISKVAMILSKRYNDYIENMDFFSDSQKKV